MTCMTDSTYHNPALAALRRQVTGRVLSGEAEAITEVTDQGERVTFTSTGATGSVLERFTRDGLGDLSGEWASVRFDDGETIDVVASSLSPVDDPSLARARYLGADAALAAASWLTMSESDARSILDDVDPMVMDRYDGPNLSGEMAGESIPEIFSDFDDPWDEALHEAWEEGRDAVWSDALQAHALRVLGDVARACEVERANEAYVDTLRVHAR